jgi:drug/metabolite transporter (DMT)-like permease
MARFNMIPLGYGFLIAFLDALMLTMVKQISLEKRQILRWMVFPTVVYAIHPWIFLKSLEFESLIVMNLIVDLASDLLVTLLGFFYFKETIGPFKVIGVILSFIAMIFMSINDNGMENFWPFTR